MNRPCSGRTAEAEPGPSGHWGPPWLAFPSSLQLILRAHEKQPIFLKKRKLRLPVNDRLLDKHNLRAQGATCPSAFIGFQSSRSLPAHSLNGLAGAPSPISHLPSPKLESQLEFCRWHEIRNFSLSPPRV